MESSAKMGKHKNGKLLLRRQFDYHIDSDNDSYISLSFSEEGIDHFDSDLSPQTVVTYLNNERGAQTKGLQGFSTVDCAVQLQPPQHGHSSESKESKLSRRLDFKFAFTWMDFTITVISTGIFFFDFISDILLANEYFYHKRWLSFGFTAGFIIFPALLSNGQSLRWYLIDYESERRKLKKHPKSRKTPFYVWILRILFTFPLMMGPAVRHIEYLYHGILYNTAKTYRDKKYHYKQMLYEDTDAALVRMFEAFLEAAPQLVLQLFIIITETPDETFHKHMIRWAAMLGSWIGLSWSLVSYHRSLRAMQHLQLDSTEDSASSPPPQEQEMSIPAVIIYFLWRACEVGPRLVVIALFASQFTYGVLIFSASHWIGMTSWLLCQKTRFYDQEHKNRRRDEVIFNIVLGYAMVFSFLNARDGHTRYRALVYYIVFYLENYVMLIMWVYWTSSKSEWYYFVAIAIVPAGMILHFTFQLFYYKACHPKSDKIQTCLSPTQQYACYQSVCHELENENEPPAFPMKRKPQPTTV